MVTGPVPALNVFSFCTPAFPFCSMATGLPASCIAPASPNEKYSLSSAASCCRCTTSQFCCGAGGIRGMKWFPRHCP